MRLVLTRRQGEAIILGPPENPIAYIYIQSINNKRVRLAIDAPLDVKILRAELVDRLKGRIILYNNDGVWKPHIKRS